MRCCGKRRASARPRCGRARCRSTASGTTARCTTPSFRATRKRCRDSSPATKSGARSSSATCARRELTRWRALPPRQTFPAGVQFDDMPQFLPFVQRWFDETFTEPTQPQRDGWNAIASGRDTLIIAPTGSGKTLAAFLWALDHLHRLAVDGRLEDRVYVVYVSPLRALNNDIEKNLREPLAGIRAAAEAAGLDVPEVRVAVRTGDTLAAARQAMTRRPPHVLITTPESLYILLTSAGFRPALAQARFVIVDEVHALLGGKRGAHLALSLERLQALVEAREPGGRPQRIGCSATVSPVEDALAFVTGVSARDPRV